MQIQDFYQLATRTNSGDFFLPNPLQKAAWDAYYDSGGHPALLVRAGTGAGKTEAVLFPALADQQSPRRVIMILPSKSLIEDMAARVEKIGERITRQTDTELAITVDMGGSCRRHVCREGRSSANTYHRHLFADDIIITTIDKFLFRMFGYGEKNKSYIFPHRIFGSAVEKKPFVIFDEAHEYDRLSFANFIKLVRTLFTKGKDLCVMSATIPESFLDFLAPVDATTGELGASQARFREKTASSPDKKLTLVSGKDPVVSDDDAGGEKSEPGKADIVENIARLVRERHDVEKRIIARTESVSDLIELYETLRDLDPLVYHGRMTTGQRRAAIKKLISAQRENKGFLVLATSAIEAGCDLDAHLIVTQLCNPDSLAQLAGRCNRRGISQDAELIVVGEKIPGFVSTLEPDRRKDYLQDLRSMEGTFQPERLQSYFQPPVGDWMGEILFDMLWDYVYEADLSAKPLHKRGILVTRSWEPAVTLCTGFDRQNRPRNPIQVGVSRLAARIRKTRKDDPDMAYKDWLKKQKVIGKFSREPDGPWHAKIFRAYFGANNPEDSRWVLKELTGNYVSTYETSLVCRIEDRFVPEYFDETLGYVKIPKIMWYGYRDGRTQYLDCLPEFKKDGTFAYESSAAYPKKAARVWFLDKMED